MTPARRRVHQAPNPRRPQSPASHHRPGPPAGLGPVPRRATRAARGRQALRGRASGGDWHRRRHVPHRAPLPVEGDDSARGWQAPEGLEHQAAQEALRGALRHALHEARGGVPYARRRPGGLRGHDAALRAVVDVLDPLVGGQAAVEVHSRARVSARRGRVTPRTNDESAAAPRGARGAFASWWSELQPFRSRAASVASTTPSSASMPPPARPSSTGSGPESRAKYAATRSRYHCHG